MLWQSLLVVKRLLLGCTVWPKKIPISLVLVLVFMVFVMLFLHIDYHLYYFFLLFDNCSMYQAGKGVWICLKWSEIIGSHDHHFSKMFPILTDCFWTSCWTAGSADHFGWDYGCQSHSEGTLEAIQEVTCLVCHFIQLVGQSVGQWNLSQRVSQSVSYLYSQSVTCTVSHLAS